jgi:hypothetical protein
MRMYSLIPPKHHFDPIPFPWVDIKILGIFYRGKIYICCKIKLDFLFIYNVRFNMKIAAAKYFIVLMGVFLTLNAFADGNPHERNHKLNRKFKYAQNKSTVIYTYSTSGYYSIFKKTSDLNYIFYRVPEKISSRRSNPDFNKVCIPNWLDRRKQIKIIRLIPVNFPERKDNRSLFKKKF